ncbi:MAG: hypothetical protein ACFFEU_13240 [Candidatus Thorarchaeota archaeon]|jgi:hypothetical protein
MIRTRRSYGVKILAVVLSSSVLISATIASLPITAYDIPPQILFEGFLQEGKFLDYDLWLDAGVWVVLEIFIEFKARIRVETWVESERFIYIQSDQSSYQGVLTLRESSLGQSAVILITPRHDTIVRVEIIDSSSTIANSIAVLSIQPWFLLVLFISLSVDGYVVSGWLRTTTRRKREREELSKRNLPNDEILIPQDYIFLSKVRSLLTKQNESDV